MNKDIPIETWRLIRTGEIRNGRKVVTFRADDQSINLLKEKGNKLYYSIRKIPVFVSKTRSLEMEQEEGEKSDMDKNDKKS